MDGSFNYWRADQLNLVPECMLAASAVYMFIFSRTSTKTEKYSNKVYFWQSRKAN